MIEEILVEIDEEISRLKQVRALLSINEAKAITTKAATRKPKWKMSIEARKKIADAQR